MVPKETFDTSDNDKELKMLKLGLFYPATRDSLPGGLTYDNADLSLKIVPVKATLRTIPWSRN